MNKKMILRKKYRSTPFSFVFRVMVCMPVLYAWCTSYVLWVYFYVLWVYFVRKGMCGRRLKVVTRCRPCVNKSCLHSKEVLFALKRSLDYMQNKSCLQAKEALFVMWVMQVFVLYV